jgi:hypothetical protein
MMQYAVNLNVEQKQKSVLAGCLFGEKRTYSQATL